MAQAFKGKLIEGVSQATRGADPSSLIRSPRFDPAYKPMGSCGEFGFCNLMAPLSCYTCSNFEPWLDGPHEKVLDFLLSERERLSGRGDARIAENARLESENQRLLEQFARWAYNAHTQGIPEEILNRALPKVHR